jgi:hypothetical protein
VLVIKRIHVRYTLGVDMGADREKIQRAFEHYSRIAPSTGRSPARSR